MIPVLLSIERQAVEEAAHCLVPTPRVYYYQENSDRNKLGLFVMSYFLVQR